MISKRFKALVCCLLTAAVVFLSILFMVVRLTSARAEGGVPGGNISNPVVQAVDIAKPAVVRIFTSINGQVTVHITATRSATFPLGGGNYRLEFSGSGAFITAHGDILTANHVIDPPHDRGLDEFLYEMAAQDVADYINQSFAVNTPYTAQDAFSMMVNGNFRTETRYGLPSSYVYLSTDYSGPSLPTDFKKVGPDVRHYVDKIEQQSATDVHDVAIIHINMSDTPSIQLGDSSGVAQLDELTIIGFPGNADISSKHDPTQMLTASVNKIYVSALKENNMGSPLIQVGGNVEHGDSGGPALDSKGNIVGVVSSYSSTADYPLGTSFLQTSSSAQTLIAAQGLDTAPGPFEKAWRRAFADYASTGPGHWHRAQQEFQGLSKQYSNFNAVTPYLNYAQEQARHEQSASAPSFFNTAGWAIGISSFVLAILIALGCLLFFRSRYRKSPLAPAVASSMPSAWAQASEAVPSNLPAFAFPEWSPQRPAGEMRASQSVSQQNKSELAETVPAWPQQSFITAPPTSITPQKEFPEPLPVPVMWRQEPSRAANLPISSSSDERRHPFSAPAPTLPSSLEEKLKAFEFPAPTLSSSLEEKLRAFEFPVSLMTSPGREIEQEEFEVPTAKRGIIRRQTMIPDANEKR